MSMVRYATRPTPYSLLHTPYSLLFPPHVPHFFPTRPLIWYDDRSCPASGTGNVDFMPILRAGHVYRAGRVEETYAD